MVPGDRSDGGLFMVTPPFSVGSHMSLSGRAGWAER